MDVPFDWRLDTAEANHPRSKTTKTLFCSARNSQWLADNGALALQFRPGRSAATLESTQRETRRRVKDVRLVGGREAGSASGRASATLLLDALAILKELGGRAKAPAGKSPRDDRRAVMAASRLQGWRHRPSVLRVGRLFALGAALRAGDVWVAGSKLHRSIEAYLSPQASAAPVPARLPAPPALTAVRYLDDRAALLDQRLLEVGRKLASGQCAGATLDRDRLSLPKPEAKDDPEARLLARQLMG